jgi:hypothetical protein
MRLLHLLCFTGLGAKAVDELLDMVHLSLVLSLP